MELISNSGMSLESFFRGISGIFILLLFAYLLSNNKSKIQWKTVFVGLSLQILIAISVLKISIIKSIFETIGVFFVKLLEYTGSGIEMLFGELADTSKYGFIFVFQALPIIIFFSALTSILYYFNIIQKIVKLFAVVLTKLLNISGSESLSVAGNIFLGQTEAPLLIKGYLNKMNQSEIFLVMVGGMSTVAGSVLGAYIGFLGGNDPILKLEFAKSLLAASVMAAPGAIVISKIIYPQTENIISEIDVSSVSIGDNFLSSISAGTSEGIKMAVNVGAMLLVFLALIAMINGGLSGFGNLFGINSWIENNSIYDSFSIEFLLGYLFAPLMWLIGVAKEDITIMGQLLGIKLVASEFVGYTQLVDLKNINSNIHFTYQKSVIMATYMLCGFANFASIGIQIGGIGIIAPKRRKMLTELGLKAMIAGTIVSLISASIAGIIIG